MSKLYFILVIVPIIIGISCSSCEKNKAAVVQETLSENMVRLTDDQFRYIKMDTVRLVNEVNQLTLNGKVCFDQNQVSKVYPFTGGILTKVFANLGDYVHKGQPLALITGGDVSTIAGSYAVAKANLELAKKTLDAAQQLYNTNVYSEKDLLAAQNEYRKAVAEEEKSKSYATMMGLNPDKLEGIYTVSAPMDGYVVEKNVSENTLIRPDNSNNLFTISSLKQVWIVADLYENDLAKVKLGDEAKVTTIAYSDKIFYGKVDQIGNFLDPVSRVAKIKVVLDNKDGLLKPEMYAGVKVYSETGNKVLQVPTKALVLEGNNYIVMIWKNDHLFEKRVVEIIHNLDDKACIKLGVQPSELVVTEGSLLVSNNDAGIVQQ